MSKPFIFFITWCLFYCTDIWAQSPRIKSQLVLSGQSFSSSTYWDANGKGSNIIVTADKKNYIAAGLKYYSFYGFLINVQKFDTLGSLIWDKDYGRTQSNPNNAINFAAINQTSDGGFIMVGSCNYNYLSAKCDHGGSDIIILKLSENGDIQWSKGIGGSGDDLGDYIEQTQDGGYILAGTSNSNDADITGNHGFYDLYVAKLSSTGDVDWSKSVGGSGADMRGMIRQLSDGNILLGATTNSQDGDIVNNPSSFDEMMVMKFDKDGNILFSNCFGSLGNDELANIKEDKDGCFIICGSVDDSTGDVKGLHLDSASVYGISPTKDGWIAKVSQAGKLLWQKCIGGSTNYDDVTDFSLTQDGYLLLTGTTQSTDGDFAGNQNKGLNDIFLAKFNSEANAVIWQKNYGGSNDDFGLCVQYFSENDFVFLGTTQSSDGDVNNTPGNGGYWLVRTGNANTIKGSVYLDANANGIKDANESFTDDIRINIKKSGYIKSCIPYRGMFNADVDTGSYEISASTERQYYIIKPLKFDTTFNSYFGTDSVSFAMQPLPNKKDVSVTLSSLLSPRIALAAAYNIVYQNHGTVALGSGNIVFIKDHTQHFVSSYPGVTQMVGDTLIWNHNVLNPLEIGIIKVNLQNAFPPIVTIGTVLQSKTYINAFTDDITPLNDTAVITETITGAIDPNNKVEGHNGTITKTAIEKGNYLVYTIRFQNVGTDTAFDISIRDTLSDKLDWNTLEIIDASNNYQFNVNDGNKCVWYFNNILLPDSNVNEQGSHGYIMYRVKTNKDLTAGTLIENSASIYFDYNLPVQTNAQKTTITDVALPLQLVSFIAQRYNESNILKWTTEQELNVNHFDIEKSYNGKDFTILQTVRAIGGKFQNNYQYNDDKPYKALNYYRLKIVDNDGKFTYSNVKIINNAKDINVEVWPNPLKSKLKLSFNSEKAMNAQIRIISTTGKIIISKNIKIEQGISVQTINVASLAAGSYFVQYIAVGEKIAIKFVKE